MDSNYELGPLTLKQRLCLALALSEAEADAALRGGTTAVNAEDIAARVNLDRGIVNYLLGSRSAIENYRINPNRMTQGQIYLIPGLRPERVRTVTEGRPYFSMEELEAAVQLPRPRLEELFDFPPLELRDKVTGRRTKLDPVPNAYVLKSRADFEAADMVESLGFVERFGGAAAPIRVLVRSDFEEPRPPHELKARFGGQVFPVLRDSEGFERYLVPGSIDIWFSRVVPRHQVLKVLDELGLRVKGGYPKVGYYLAELRDLPEDLDVTRATLEKIEEANRRPEIRFAEAEQMGFENFGPEHEREIVEFEDVSTGSRSWNLDAIELDAAHAITKGSPNVTIFVIDSGMRLDHPDLDDALRPDWTTLDLNFDLGVPDSETSPQELAVAHGTRVTGVAVGRASDTEFGSRGVAPGCWVVPVKISGTPFSQPGYGLRAAAILEVLDYVAAGQRGVINISWSTNGEHIGIREALIDADRKGLAIVASGGNYGISEIQVADKPHYPSGYAFLPGDTEVDVAGRRKIRGLCSVAALNSSKVKASYSYFGARSVTVSAPGGEPGLAGIGIFLASTPANYDYGAGTSFASPHVSGLIALLLSLDPNLKVQRAIEILRETATDIDVQNPGFVGMLGAGLINARRALESLGPGASRGAVTSDTERSTTTPINVNTATFEELVALPLLGPWSAARIIAYRGQHGPFATIWDLTLTGAIDTWTIQQIQDLITAGAVSVPNVPTPAAEPSPTPGADSRLNINTATFEELVALPLLGPWSAARIIAYRGQHGPFASIGDLTLTGAVDAWTVQHLKPLITAY